MPEMTRMEKFFVNRHGTRTVSRVLSDLDHRGQPPATSSSEVLELGAGNGRLSVLVNERYHPAHIRLTDYDLDQLGVARKTVKQHYSSVPAAFILERADATALHYPNESIDLVLAHNILHHLGNTSAILRGLDEVHRVLRPGGRFFYAEMFHKSEIREHLSALGFVRTYRKRALRLFTTVEFVVVAKPVGSHDAVVSR